MNFLTMATKKTSLFARAIMPPRKYPKAPIDDDGQGSSYSHDRRKCKQGRVCPWSLFPAKTKRNEKNYRIYRYSRAKKSEGKGATMDFGNLSADFYMVSSLMCMAFHNSWMIGQYLSSKIGWRQNWFWKTAFPLFRLFTHTHEIDQLWIPQCS